MEFRFNKEKNEKLLNERGMSFYMVIEAIAEKGILLNLDHPDQKGYPNQKIIVVNIDGYAYCVPYVVQENDVWFLKTIYPNRKFKAFIKGDDYEEEI